MIIDEKTRHYHNRIICRERNLESMAGKPVLLRCILPLLRGRFFRSGLSLHCFDRWARGWLKPRISSLEEKTCWGRDGKTREGETVQVKWTSSDSSDPSTYSSTVSHRSGRERSTDEQNSTRAITDEFSLTVEARTRSVRRPWS